MPPPTPPNPSAVQIVRHLLNNHGHLKSTQLYEKGLAEFPSPSVIKPPPPKPTQIVDENGNVRMRKAANVRGGRIAFMPMPTKPYPDHPFQGMKYFKTHILHNLERLDVIRTVQRRVPLDAAGLVAAEEQAEKERRRARRYSVETFMAWKKGSLSRIKVGRKAERKDRLKGGGLLQKLPEDAKKMLDGLLVGEELEMAELKYGVRQVEPATQGKEWVWEMVLPQEEEPVPSDVTQPPAHPDAIPYASPWPPKNPSILDHPLVVRRWEQALEIEKVAKKAEAMEQEEIRIRKEERSRMYRELRENKKLAREKLKATGMSGGVMAQGQGLIGRRLMDDPNEVQDRGWNQKWAGVLSNSGRAEAALSESWGRRQPR